MSDNSLQKELAKGDTASVVNLTNHLIEQAHAKRASDIHVDPGSKNVRIRFRIDGVLQDICEISKKIHPELISRIKILSKLRTDEHQATQDGRFRHTTDDKKESIDIRVSIAPTYHGENAVMRLLSNKAEHFTLKALGFSDSDIKKIEQALAKPNGMILSTGPTGSGKTTTLYTLLQMINSKEVSIVTIEDPIEYAIDEIKQIQVQPRTGLTFATGLRSVLRQDPNIIMVGEIRDSETAHIAVNTALTGHLLLSTLHTNDASTTLPRLLDMGIEPYLVASTISVSIGQRLVRKICKHCKEKTTLPPALEKRMSLYGTTLSNSNRSYYKGKGCDECVHSGYLGRICINEVLVADDEIRQAIVAKVSASDIKKIAVKNGMTTMIEDGFKKVENGETTIEEVLRVVYE